ncbi:MAG: hypothetical protein ABIA78_03750 [archaeon]
MDEQIQQQGEAQQPQQIIVKPASRLWHWTIVAVVILMLVGFLVLAVF